MSSAEELERALKEEESRMKAIQEEIARLKKELQQEPLPPKVVAQAQPLGSASPVPTRSPISPTTNGNAHISLQQTAQPVRQAMNSPTMTRAPVAAAGGNVAPNSPLTRAAAPSAAPMSQSSPNNRHVAQSMGASMVNNGNYQPMRPAASSVGDPKRTLARPPPPSVPRPASSGGALSTSTPAVATPLTPPVNRSQSSASLTISTPVPTTSFQAGKSPSALSLSYPQPQPQSAPVARRDSQPSKVATGGFSASALIADARDRSDSFDLIGTGIRSQPSSSNLVQTRTQASVSSSPTPLRSLPSFSAGSSTGGRSPSLQGNVNQGSPRQQLQSSFSTSNFGSPFQGGFSASGLGSSQGIGQDDDGGGMLSKGFQPMSPGGSFTASSLLGSFNSDEAEMLRGPIASSPSNGAPPMGGGFLLNPNSSSGGSGEDGSLIGGPTIGYLPSATPQMMAAESSVEKGLDRVEDDLVYFSKNFQIILKGGTITKVIERLTAESQADNSVVDTFLLTYRKFISPELLLEELMKRYNLPPPQSMELMDQHSISVYDRDLKVVRLRVGNFIRRWLSEHFQDFKGNEALIDRLAVMCKQTFFLNEKTLGERILNTLEEQRKKLEGDEIRQGSVTSRPGERPEAIVPKSRDYNDFDPIEVARQLALFEQNIYRQIHPKECLDQCWSKKDRYTRAPNLMRLIDFFNQFAGWVATTILKHKGIEDRVREMKRFMRMAIELRRLNNFNGCQEVLAGLSDSSIYRLKATWLKVEKDEKLMADFAVIKRALAPDRSWVNYRALLKEIQPPCIPYLGVYLTDLTFIEDGNPNYLPTVDNRTDIINFEKCRKQALVIGNILLYQQDSYNFQKVDVIYEMFAKGLAYIEDPEALHKLSRTVESQEMVDEAKKKALKRVEKDTKKKDSTPGKGPNKPTSSTSSMSMNSMNSMASSRGRDGGSVSARDGSPNLTSSPSQRFENPNPERR